jgi:hypothetical protein
VLTITGSSNSGTTDVETDSLKNSKLNFGYQSNGVYPGGIVYTASGYYPGGGVYYPAGAGGRYPVSNGKLRNALLIKILPLVYNVTPSGEKLLDNTGLFISP